ncbi:hypothetical protein JYU34_003408 [Plutella xylostella]|uniref:Reverse transcriptase Ty1/copia-type domain-containing protein n=1 Tax=Plutella xylostella TaxID=51655 RepID=A0ABQ7R005_PLUXY|nr:hypothetical protein JYU34_003408 [Plutella xylostella]
MEKTRCMLQEAGLEQKYWAEAVNTAVYLKNRSPTMSVKGYTPEEKWTGKRVSVSYLRIFGCVAYAQKHLKKKLDPKAKRYIFVGYCESTKGYRLINPENPGELIKARDVTFIESQYYKEIVSHDDNRDVVLPLSTSVNTQPPTESYTDTAEEIIPVEEHSDDTIRQNAQRYSTITVNDSDSEGEERDTDDPLDKTYIPDETSSEDSSTGYSDCDDDSLLAHLASGTHSSSADEPQTVQEALGGPDRDSWLLAMQDEYNSFLVNECWTLTDKVDTQKPIKCKWVFKRKRGLNGELLKYKARLVAKGFTQKSGIDYKETFAPVVRYSSIRALLALAAEYDLDIDHLDVKTAFLNGDLQETVYLEQPEGFVMKGQEGKVYKLNKAIYGLKQAAKAWYDKINNVLCKKLGFSKSSSEPCVYHKSGKHGLTILALYVDDILLFTERNSQEKDLIKQKLNMEFEITDLGPASHILGMRLCKHDDRITLDQSKYIESVLQKFKMEDCKPSATPMETGVKLTKALNSGDISKFDYRGLIGSLMYIAVGTRPDIAHAVSYLSQFNDCYDESHWKAAKRVIRYLKGNKDLCLNFVKGGISITAYADADWGRNESDRRSYTGYVFKLGESIVSWESRKQRTVALSSTEAEYMAISDACKEALFLRQFLHGILGKTLKVKMYNDNQSAQNLCKNAMLHARTKHIDIRHHFIREHVLNGIIDVQYLCTSDMIADVFTKPLCKETHYKFVKQLMLL